MISVLLVVFIVLNFSMVSYADVKYGDKTYTDKEYLKAVNNTIEHWLEQEKWDFLGKHGAELVNVLKIAYVGEEHYTEDGLLKLSGIKRGLEFDKATLGKQLKLTEKQINDNDFIYGTLIALVGGGIWGTKVYLAMSDAKKLKLIKFLLGGNAEMGMRMLIQGKK